MRTCLFRTDWPESINGPIEFRHGTAVTADKDRKGSATDSDDNFNRIPLNSNSYINVSKVHGRNTFCRKPYHLDSERTEGSYGFTIIFI